ncbi:hypothetical protein A0H76_2715 [Hepatospora eriocheir]|uniref:Uncharacterized protein n=1 Tax=Hepatospora eriocheir TaxID=1081669 RepID=A0A1X0QEW3_9MICR|nr:hypothetical protein A0H76_2715 [Hepatospora eriocheir]
MNLKFLVKYLSFSVLNNKVNASHCSQSDDVSETFYNPYQDEEISHKARPFSSKSSSKKSKAFKNQSKQRCSEPCKHHKSGSKECGFISSCRKPVKFVCGNCSFNNDLQCKIEFCSKIFYFNIYKLLNRNKNENDDQVDQIDRSDNLHESFSSNPINDFTGGNKTFTNDNNKDSQLINTNDFSSVDSKNFSINEKLNNNSDLQNNDPYSNQITSPVLRQDQDIKNPYYYNQTINTSNNNNVPFTNNSYPVNQFNNQPVYNQENSFQYQNENSPYLYKEKCFIRKCNNSNHRYSPYPKFSANYQQNSFNQRQLLNNSAQVNKQSFIKNEKTFYPHDNSFVFNKPSTVINDQSKPNFDTTTNPQYFSQTFNKLIDNAVSKSYNLISYDEFSKNTSDYNQN